MRERSTATRSRRRPASTPARRRADRRSEDRSLDQLDEAAVVFEIPDLGLGDLIKDLTSELFMDEEPLTLDTIFAHLVPSPTDAAPPQPTFAPPPGVTPNAVGPSSAPTVLVPPSFAPDVSGAPPATSDLPLPTASVATPSGEGPTPDAAPQIPLIMPEPEPDLSEEEQTRIQRVKRRVHRSARREADVPDAQANQAGVHGAVKEPDAETLARAEQELIARLASQPQPSPKIVALCKRIKKAIRSRRPSSEKALLKSDFQQIANQAGSELNQTIQDDSSHLQQQYSDINHPKAGAPLTTPKGIVPPPNRVPRPNVDATSAVPNRIPPENLSLQGDVHASQTRIDAAGMNTPVAQVIQSGPVAAARAGQANLEATAAAAEAAMRAEQERSLTSAQTNMALLQMQALESLNRSRRGSIRGTGEQQTSGVKHETDRRVAIGNEANKIFKKAQGEIRPLLRSLKSYAVDTWEAEKTVLAQDFQDRLAAVDRWKASRYSGVSGSIVKIWDRVTGMPDWVPNHLNAAEKAFGDGVCNVLLRISRHVNGIIAACEEILATARREIDNLYIGLPKELTQWATEQRADYQARLDGLQREITHTRDNVNQEIAFSAVQAVQEVRDEIGRRREEAKGILQQIGEAIGDFIDDPVTAIINGLLKLAGIPPPTFWNVVERISSVIGDIANDPLAFAGNLMSAIGQGFSQFWENFGEHLLKSFWEWLFSGLSKFDVEIPTEFSLSSIVTFILQVLGISWEKLRAVLAKHLGEENIAMLERAWELIAELIEKGPEGIYEMLRERFDPQAILDAVLESLVSLTVETLVERATVKIALLFNPVGAIAQAVMAIYKLLKWVFSNAARIFTLIETVVNGIAEIVAGNTQGMADAVEQALAGLIRPVIEFFASLVDLDDLPDSIGEAIGDFQDWIEGMLDQIMEALAKRVRELLETMGIGEEEEEEQVAVEAESDPAEDDNERWWEIKLPFVDASGDSHTLLFQGSASNVTLAVRSDIQPVTAWLQEHKNDAQEEEIPLIQAAQDAYDDYLSSETALETFTQKRNSLAEEEKEALKPEYEKLRSKLKDALRTVGRTLSALSVEAEPNEIVLKLPEQKPRAVYDSYRGRLAHSTDRAERHTNQLARWEAEVKSQLSRDSAWYDTFKRLQALYPERLASDQHFLRPNWDARGTFLPDQMEVDHIVEWQVRPLGDAGGRLLDDVWNYELLDKPSNTASGSKIKDNIVKQRQALAQEMGSDIWLHRDIVFTRFEGGGSAGTRWSLSEIQEGAHIQALIDKFGQPPLSEDLPSSQSAQEAQAGADTWAEERELVSTIHMLERRHPGDASRLRRLIELRLIGTSYENIKGLMRISGTELARLRKLLTPALKEQLQDRRRK